jgi:hypothetical protein
VVFFSIFFKKQIRFDSSQLCLLPILLLIPMLSLNDDCLLEVFKFVVRDLQDDPATSRRFTLESAKRNQLFHLAHINKRCRLALLSSVRLCKLDQKSVEKNKLESLVDPYYKYFSVCNHVFNSAAVSRSISLCGSQEYDYEGLHLRFSQAYRVRSPPTLLLPQAKVPVDRRLPRM